MPGMPDLMLQAPVFRRLKKLTRLPGASTHPKLDEAIQRFSGPMSDPNNRLLKIAKDFGLYKDDTEAEHLKKHWLGDPTGTEFWPNVTKIEEIIREGLRVALELFRENQKPFEIFWTITSSNATDLRWEVSVTAGTDNNFLVFHTPQIPCPTPTKASTTIWIVREENGAVNARSAQVPI